MQLHVKKNILIVTILFCSLCLLMLVCIATADGEHSRDETRLAHEHTVLSLHKEHPQIFLAVSVIALGTLAVMSLSGAFFSKKLEVVEIPTATAKKQDE